MASQLNITFDYNEATTLNYGRIEVVHITEAGQRNTYTLFPFTISDTGPAATFAVSSTNDAFTAQQFAFVFNTKFRGPINGNFNPMFEVNGNVVSLIAETGTFLPATYRDGDVLDIIPVVTDLENPPQNTFRFGQDVLQRGDCLTTRWSFTFAQGGDPPYNIISSDTEEVLVQNWSGFTTENVDFARGQTHTGRVEDQNGDFIGTYNIFSPQNILNSDFTTEQRNFINTSDLIVNQIVVRTNTGADRDANGALIDQGRIEYAIAQFVPGVGVDLNALVWQESNIFAGLVPGRYKLYIRDKYGCIISRDIQINEFDPTINLEPGEVTDYFSVTEYNSLAFKRSVDWNCEIRKNYDTTLSYEEAVCLPYQAVFRFPLGRTIQTQFKSSYPYHIVTFYKCDGTNLNLPTTRIQENISIIERVSAKLFPYNDGQTERIGIYFEGGDLFETGTTDAIGDSPYFQVLPTWAQVDRIIEISTESGLNFGARTIIQTDLFDSQRNTLFMVTDGSIGQETDIQDAIVEVRYNRHPYDVYRFDLTMHDGSGFVVIEPGFSADSIVQNEIRVSETFQVLKNCDNWIVSEWYLNRSVGEAVAYESFKGELWMQGRLRPISIGSAETLDADDQTRSLDQDEKLGMRLTVNILEPKKWRKLGLASAIGNRGEFIIEDLPLVRTAAMTQDELGQTNKSNIEIEFAYAAETPRTRQEDVVLDIGVGGGDGTPTAPVTGWNGWIRIIRSDSPLGVPTFLKDHQGNFLVAGRIDV